MRDYSWEESGKIEGLTHKELLSIQMIQYMDWFRMDRSIFEFEKGMDLFTLFRYYGREDHIVNKIPMKSIGSVGEKGIIDKHSLREQRGSFLDLVKSKDESGLAKQDDNKKFNTIDYVYDDFEVKGGNLEKSSSYARYYKDKYIFRRYFTNEGKRSIDSFSDYAEMKDEDLSKWKIIYSGDHHKVATDYFEIFLKKEWEKKCRNN